MSAWIAPIPLAAVAGSETDDNIFELLPAAVYVCDAEGKLVRYNQKAAEFWGQHPRHADPATLFCGSYRRYRPDGRALTREDTPMADAIRTGRSYRGVE